MAVLECKGFVCVVLSDCGIGAVDDVDDVEIRERMAQYLFTILVQGLLELDQCSDFVWQFRISTA